eukprot:gene47939-58727_t
MSEDRQNEEHKNRVRLDQLLLNTGLVASRARARDAIQRGTVKVDGRTVTKEDVISIADWLTLRGKAEKEIAYRPARVLMQDFTGVPAVVDLAAMRNAMQALGGDAEKINPLVPVDLVIDHSVIVNFFGTDNALKKNVDEEYKQNQERYRFLKWGQSAFDNFRVVPPGTGICHQVNLEYL